MAINTEDPEEGTPKSKKDIRRERRQMRAINAERPKYSYTSEGEKVKNAPLYSKEEIRAVGKIVEPGKSKVMTEADSSAQVKYNDPNKPAEYSEFEYKQYEPGGYTRSIRPMTEEEFNANTKSKRILISPEGKYIVSKDYNDYLRLMNEKYNPPSKEIKTPVTQEQFQTIVGNPNEDPNNEKIRQERETLKNTLLNPSNATTVTDVIQTKVDNDNTLTLKEKEDLTKTSIVAGNETDKIDKDITNEELQNKSQIQTLTQGPKQYNWTDAYVKEGFTPESPEAILSRAADAARKKAPSLVVEKLGVQDYYPEIGRDIAVGTFTGSRIGSQTIYSGAGGLLPLGLYDARKRAIAADIKKKEALMDQLKEIPDIAKQFKPAFAQDFYEGLQPYLDAYKNNPEGLASDSGFLKYIANKKSVGEDFIKVDAYLRDLEDKIVNKNTGQPAAWVPKGVLEIINNIKSGMVPGKIEDYFSGKKNISKVLNTVRALPNALNQADKIVAELLSKGGVETAINMKTGENFTEKDMAELNTLIQQINSPSPDYEMFAELKRKFFDFKYDKMADAWVKLNMQDQPESIQNEVKKTMADYIESQMPQDAIISNITKQANDYTTRRGQDLNYASDMANLAFRERQWQEGKETPVNAALKSLNSVDDRSLVFGTAQPKSVSISNGEVIYEVYSTKKGEKTWVTGDLIKKSPPGSYKYGPGTNDFVVPDKDIKFTSSRIKMFKDSKGNKNIESYGTGLYFDDNNEPREVGVPVRLPYSTLQDKNGVVIQGPMSFYNNMINANQSIEHLEGSSGNSSGVSVSGPR